MRRATIKLEKENRQELTPFHVTIVLQARARLAYKPANFPSSLQPAQGKQCSLTRI